LAKPGTNDAKMSRRTIARRMGPAGSQTWHAILDGAEDLVREEGYAALNAKRIAEHMGIKRQLIYYYFCDIDDLMVQLFHRIADRELQNLEAALQSDNPLRKTWDIGIDTFDPTLLLEFMALSNRNARVRKEVLDYAMTARDIQVSALTKMLKDQPLPRVEIPLPALAFIATWLAIGLQREAAIGISNGHDDVSRLIQDFMVKCENTVPPASI
jgi:AcrR family transcriptional regulator